MTGRFLNRVGLATTAVVVLTVAVFIGRVAGSGQANSSRSHKQPGHLGTTTFGPAADSKTPPYEELFGSTSLVKAQESVDFEIQMPETQWANVDLLQGAYLLPGGALALDFPPPEEPREYVRQEYLEVYEAPWTWAVDPLDFYKRNLSEDPNPDASLIEIEGLPALIVTAHSEWDDEKANPAFLRVVVNGVELQISGGEDIDRLIAIAESMVHTAKTSQ